MNRDERPAPDRAERPAERPVRPAPGRAVGPRVAKARPKTTKGRGGPGHETKIRWTGFRTLYDFWGEPIVRHYTLDSLANAIDWTIRRKDPIFAPTVHAILGPSPLTGYHFELFQEGRFQMIFHMTAGNTKAKQAHCAVVAAKREGEVSKLARREFDNLALLNGRAPDHVVRPYFGAQVFMARAKPGKGGQPRFIYIYTTQWLHDFHELGVQRDMQFYINTAKPITFTLAHTEVIKRKIIEIIARTYSTATRDSMEMPQVASGDFVVTKPSRGEPNVKLIACRRLLRNMSPEKLVGRIARSQWDWGGRPFTICPADPRTLIDGIAAARGAEEAALWVRAYCDAVKSRILEPPALWHIRELRNLL